MGKVNFKKLTKEMTSEELARKLADEVNLITLKRSVQIAELLREERREKMKNVLDGLEKITEEEE